MLGLASTSNPNFRKAFVTVQLWQFTFHFLSPVLKFGFSFPSLASSSVMRFPLLMPNAFSIS